jgi:predicted Zn-dependent protease
MNAALNGTFTEQGRNSNESADVRFHKDELVIKTSDGNTRIYPYKLIQRMMPFPAGLFTIIFKGLPVCYLELPYNHVIYKQVEKKSRKLYTDKVLLAAGIFIILALVLFFFITPVINRLIVNNISVETEQIMGDKIYKSIMQQHETDTLLTNKTRIIAGHLKFKSPCPINITVVKSNEANAFALPGGYIVIYDSLLKSLTTSDELAALLGHEATHIVYRHSLKALTRDLSRNIILSLVLGDAGSLTNVIVNNANQLSSLSYSRNMEFEADQGAADILLNNGMDINGLKNLLLVLKKHEGESQNKLTTYLSTHPDTDERIAKTKMYESPQAQDIHNQLIDSLFIELKPLL